MNHDESAMHLRVVDRALAMQPGPQRNQDCCDSSDDAVSVAWDERDGKRMSCLVVGALNKSLGYQTAALASFAKIRASELESEGLVRRHHHHHQLECVKMGWQGLGQHWH